MTLSQLHAFYPRIYEALFKHVMTDEQMTEWLYTGSTTVKFINTAC